MIEESDTVCLWLTFLDDIEDKKHLEEYKKIVTAEELVRMEKFHHDSHKTRYLAGRVLARTILSRFTGIPPDLIAFSKTSLGRPFLRQQDKHPKIRFSISYTKDLIAFALVLRGDVGVDIEYTDVDIDCLDIAKQYFSAAEYNHLMHLPEEQVKDGFFKYWTLKESYIKARGRGLTMPLSEFSFNIPSRDAEEIRIFPAPEKNQKHWYFRLMDPGRNYKAALSIYRKTEDPFQITIKKTVPLLFESAFPCT